MAITLEEGFPSEDYEVRGFKVGEDGTWTANRRWTLKFDLTDATPDEIAGLEFYVEAAVPVARYDSHPANGAAFARTLDVTRTGLDSFKAEVGYSSARLASGTSTAGLTGTDASKPSEKHDQSTPADQRFPQIHYTRKERRKPLEKDAANGLAVKNTAGDPFDPPIEVDRSKYVINITWWKPFDDFTLSSWLAFQDKLNDATVTILGINYPQKTLRVILAEPKLVWDTADAGGGRKTVSLFWELHAQLEYDPDTHAIPVLNQGKRYLPSGTGPPRNVSDGKGSDSHDPVLLASNGDKLASGGTPVYLTWNGYVTATFSSFLV